MTWLSTLRFLACGLVLLLLAGFVYERLARSSAARNFPPRGEFIEVSGHKLHVVREGHIGPSVVFESGLDAGGHLPWLHVQREVAAFATTLSYDRAGILWSERGENPKSCKSIAAELHALLEASKMVKPYILVGHSFAGLTLRCFVANHPDEVAGIVFVDVSHPGLATQSPAEAKALTMPIPRWQMELARSLGLARIFFSSDYPRTQNDDPINVEARKNGIRGLRAVYDEMESFETVLSESGEITSFGDLPLLVITGTAPERSMGVWPNEELRLEMDRLWSELQLDLLKLSSNSRQILATKSGHYVQMEQPDLVVSAIRSLIPMTPWGGSQQADRSPSR